MIPSSNDNLDEVVGFLKQVRVDVPQCSDDIKIGTRAFIEVKDGQVLKYTPVSYDLINPDSY